MPEVALFVIAGQSNARFAGIDNRLYELATAQGRDFTIIRTALGGTSLFPTTARDWDPASGELFTALVDNVRTTKAQIRVAGGVPVVHTFWVHGERDQQRSDYGTKLADFIDQYRSQIDQPNSTFAISLLPYAAPARDGQLSVAASVPHVVTIDPVGATTWDGVHYERPTRLFQAEAFFAATGATIGSASAYDNRLAVADIKRDAEGFTVIGPRYTDYVWNNTTARVRIKTVSGDDVIRTGDFDDEIATGGNDDRVNAGGGNDLIDLGEHNDQARAGAGNDTVFGSFGNDWIAGEDGDDTLFGNDQNDQLHGGNGDDLLDGGKGDDRLFGDTGRDTLIGHDQNDQLYGGNGDDLLEGGKGDDRLFGDAGRDTLGGGAGVDRLTGGADADRFVFAAADFGRSILAGRDIIADFSAAAGDIIDLTLIDADRHAEDNNPFTFIGTQPFQKVAGELRMVVLPTHLNLEGDVNGDGVVDVLITLLNVRSISLDNIIL